MDTHHTAQADGFGTIPPERRVIGTIVTGHNGLPQWQHQERADCLTCEGRAIYGRGGLRCRDCMGTGKQLTRADYLTLAADDDDSFTETDIGHDVEDAY